jgi:hypothetical protein
MVEAGSVRLRKRSTRIIQSREAAVNSSSAVLPFGNKALPSGERRAWA